MTINLTLPQINTNSLKDQIITLLVEEKALNAKEIYSKIVKNKAISYQAIHKTLIELTSEGVLEKKQTKALEEFIKSELDKQSKMPIILLTHHVNIRAFMGKNVNQGDMVLVKVNKNGEYLSHVIYPSPKP